MLSLALTALKALLGNTRFWAGVVILAALALSHAGVYIRGYDVARWKYESKVQSLQGKLDELNSKMKVQSDAAKTEVANLKTEQKGVVDALQTELVATRAKVDGVRTVTKTITKYVTAKADAACLVPVGAAWVLDNAIAAGTGAAMASSPPADVDAPSGVTLSRLTAVTNENYAECVERGKIIDSWQRWYTENERLHNEAVKHYNEKIGASQP